jgi:hypothetical protein
MTINSNISVSTGPTCIGPYGERMSVADLPPSGTKRWVMRRKAQVVLAVRSNLIGFDEACSRYQLTEEELNRWHILIDRYGFNALKTTKIQDYRQD